MATSGSTSVTVTKYDTLKFSWQESSQSIENNSTAITWKMELIATSYGRIDSTASKDWSVTVNGTNYSGTTTIGIGNNETKTLASGTTTIAHNADGTKTFSYSFSQEIRITFSGEWIGTKSGSGTGTLDTIARASQPSCITYPNHTQNVGNFGDTISIHMNRNSSSFTHTVRYAFGSQSGTCINADTGAAATGIGTGIKWKIPESFMNLLPSDTSGSGTIYVDTYNGSTKIGTKYCGFTATVPSSVKPTCSFVLEDVANIDDIYGKPVKNLSRIKITVTGNTAYSSPIDSYVIAVNGATYSGSTVTTVLSKSGTSTVTATVKDERGRTGTATYDMDVLDYTPPAVNSLTVVRCDQNGTVNKRGAYIKAVFSATVSSMSSKNTAQYKLRYKKTTDSAYTEVTLSALANNYAVTNYAVTPFAASLGNSYDVVVSVTDRHNTANPATRSEIAPTGATWFSVRGFKKSSGKEYGVGIGRIPEKENTLQVAYETEFEKSTVQLGNSYSYQPGAFNGEKGYTLLAVIKLTTLNVNAPIVFEINRRGAICPMTVYVRFASSSSSTDPGLGSITYEGDNYGAFLVKSATSTWKLYVDNTSGWSNPCLQSWRTTDNQNARMAVEFMSEQIAALPEPYYRATPAKMPSILDFVYPVGSIYFAYNHTSPATLFGGTWVRIEDAFLWATTASGTIGQTGGSATHTLTTAELPSHSHNISVANTASGSTAASNRIRYNNDASSYVGTLSSNAAGSGQAHNNMPPYIQVSVWRRTA